MVVWRKLGAVPVECFCGTLRRTDRDPHASGQLMSGSRAKLPEAIVAVGGTRVRIGGSVVFMACAVY